MKCPILCVFVYCVFGVAGAAHAQAAQGDPTREATRIQEREAERQRARQEEFDRAQTRPPSGEPAPAQQAAEASSGACVPIKAATIEGMARYRPEAFADTLAGLVGDCISIDAINGTLRAITNRYVADGYITSRAVVGPQDLKSGKLVITVFEGRLDGIRSEKGGYGHGEIALAFPGLKDRLLNLRDIEQGVDQLSRLGGADPDIDIEPGTLPGTSTLLVRRKRLDAPVRPSLSASNDGSQSTGRLQSTLTVDFDSPLGLADFWSLYYTRGLENSATRRSEGFGFFVSLPYGHWTVSATAGQFRYRSLLTGNGLSFANTGTSRNGSLAADRLLYRDAKTKISVSASLAIIDTLNRIQGIRLSTGSYRLVTGAINGRAQRRLGQGLLSLGLGFSRGLGILGAQTVFTGPGGPSRIYRKIEGDLGYQARANFLGIPLTYSGLVRAQAALDPVFPAERFSLGGSSTVRGFRDDGISGRTGFAVRQQFGCDVVDLFRDASPALQTRVSAFVAHDVGGIAPRKGDAFERGIIQSSVIGLRAQNRRIQTEMALGLPLSAPAFVRRKTAEFSASVRLAL